MVPITWLFTAAAVIVGTLSVSVLLFLKKRNKYWEERGVPGPKPALFFGNVKDSMMVKLTEAQVVDEIVEKYKDQKVIGIFNLWKPVFLIRDWEVAKRVTEKDAESFIDHPPIISEELTDYAFYSIFTMMGSPWKSRRQVLNKLFTPKKLKDYFEDFRPGLDTFIGKLQGDVECLELLVSFTAQTIMQAFYGLDLSSDSVRTDELVDMVRYFIHPPFSTVVKVITYSIMPGIFRLLRIGTMPPLVWRYARRLYHELVQTRRNATGERDDGLNLIMKLEEQGSPTFGKIENKEAIGHMFQFLMGGVHTSAVVMSHTLVHLAKYPEVLAKVRKEVDDILQGASTVTYEHISQMKYLDAVLLETMRLVPLTGILKRTCTKDYELVPGLRVQKGMDMWVDVTGIHRDPGLFPQPDRFYPERWESGQAEPAAFLAFGKGPRLCIGKRLAEIQAKLLLSTVISKFDLLPSSKNRTPFKPNPNTIIITSIPEGGNWVHFQPRK